MSDSPFSDGNFETPWGDRPSSSPEVPTPLIRGPNGFADSPFALSGNELEAGHSQSGNTVRHGPVTVISDNNVSDAVVDDILALVAPPQSELSQSPELLAAGYQLRVFVSKDDSYLRDLFEKTQPAANEVCLFLEDNSSDYVSGASSYVAVGSEFREDLSKRRDVAKDAASRVASSSFQNQAAQSPGGTQFSASEIETLISEGRASHVARETLITLFQIANWGTVLLAPVYGAIGDGIAAATEAIRGVVKFSDAAWDPQADVYTNSEHTFSPALLPLADELVDLVTLGGEGALEIAESTMRSRLSEQRTLVQSAWSGLLALPGAEQLMPVGLQVGFESAQQTLESLLDSLMQGLKDALSIYISIGSKWMNAVNAFICGLWNAGVEAILGLVDLIGLLFKGLSLAGDAVNEAQDLVPQGLELVDELLQAMMTIDLAGMVEQTFSAIAQQLRRIGPLDLMGSVSIERVSYYLGAFVGFVVEMAIGMGTGGTSNLASISTKFAKFGRGCSDVVGLITKGLTKACQGARSLAQRAIQLVKAFITLLKQGKQALAELVDTVFRAAKQAANLTQEAIAKIVKATGLDEAFVRSLDSLGYKVTNIAEDACTVCMKP